MIDHLFDIENIWHMIYDMRYVGRKNDIIDYKVKIDNYVISSFNFIQWNISWSDKRTIICNTIFMIIWSVWYDTIWFDSDMI